MKSGDGLVLGRVAVRRLIALLDNLNGFLESAVESHLVGDDTVLPRNTERQYAEQVRRDRRLRRISEEFLFELCDAVDWGADPMEEDSTKPPVVYVPDVFFDRNPVIKKAFVVTADVLSTAQGKEPT